MTAVVLAASLLTYAAVLGFALPRVLSRSAWPSRAPRLAMATWHAAGITTIGSVALALLAIAMPLHALGGGPVAFLQACLQPTHAGGAPGGVATRVAAAVALILLLSRIVIVSLRRYRAWRADTARHVEAVGLLARPDSRNSDVRVVPCAQPAAFCLPRQGGVVVTSAATEALDDDEMQAVLAHERAHLRQRHHVAILVADTLAEIAPAPIALPVLVHGRREVARLSELAADDAASRAADRGALVDAMLAMAQHQVPSPALGAASTGVVERVTRLLEAPAPLGRRSVGFAGGAVAVAAATPLAVMLVPVLLLPVAICSGA